LVGIKKYLEGSGVEIQYANSSDFNIAKDIAKKSDISIIFSGAWALEGIDRYNLNLINKDDKLIEEIASVQKIL